MPIRNIARAPAARIVGAVGRIGLAPQLDEMFETRKQVFIDMLKWDLQVTDGKYDIDEYDHDDTIYLMIQDAGTGGHLGSVRLLPTDGAHLLGDKFAWLCADGVPRGPDIYEITRMVTRPGLPRAAAERVREQLSVAIVEFALAHGIRHFTMMTHMAFLAGVIAVGWDCEPLGLPHAMDGVEVAALKISVDGTTLARLRRRWNFASPVLRLDLSESALAM